MMGAIIMTIVFNLGDDFIEKGFNSE